LSGELNVPSLPLGTVIWQTPLAGLAHDADNPDVSVLVSSRRVSLCHTKQLLGRYLGGGRGTGMHFGSIAILDVSPQACLLTGRLELYGADHSGRRVTDQRSQLVSTNGFFALTPNATPKLLRRRTPAAMIATFGFSGNERDPASPDGLCHHPAMPQTWHLTVNRTERIGFANRPDPYNGPFATCHGQLLFGGAFDGSGTSGVALLGP
jgi:hypothetical protein